MAGLADAAAGRQRRARHLQRFLGRLSLDRAQLLGKLRALRVERIRDSGDGRTTTLWLGPDKNFVPLKIVQTEANGETFEMRVTGVR